MNRELKRKFIGSLFPGVDSSIDTVIDGIQLHIVYTAADIPPLVGAINLGDIAVPYFINARR